MRIAILFFVSILFCGFIIPKSSDDEKEAVYIYLASGYTNDTVCLSVNTIQILKNEIVNSRSEYNDLTDGYIKITKDSIFHYRDGSIVSKRDIKRDNKSVKILLTINEHPYSYTMYLKRGKYLFISKHSIFYNVYFNQFKRPVTLY